SARSARPRQYPTSVASSTTVLADTPTRTHHQDRERHEPRRVATNKPERPTHHRTVTHDQATDQPTGSPNTYNKTVFPALERSLEGSPPKPDDEEIQAMVRRYRRDKNDRPIGTVAAQLTGAVPYQRRASAHDDFERLLAEGKKRILLGGDRGFG